MFNNSRYKRLRFRQKGCFCPDLKTMSERYREDYGDNQSFSDNTFFRPFLVKEKEYIDIVPSDLSCYDPEDCTIKHPSSYWNNKQSFAYKYFPYSNYPTSYPLDWLLRLDNRSKNFADTLQSRSL